MVTMLTLLMLAQTDALAPLLEKGQLVLVEQTKDGKFGSATGIVLINAPPEKVWKTLLKMEDFKTFMPKATTSDDQRRAAAGEGRDGRAVRARRARPRH